MTDRLSSFSDDLAAAVDAAGRATVAVQARQRFASSGLHWGGGYIVTADHTIRREEDIEVVGADGEAHAATLVGRDPATDVALLKIDDQTLPTADVIDIAALKPGHLVLAVARSPEDGVGTSLGVLSAVSGPWRTWRGGQLEAFVQPDLRLYPGFSGGPLIDARGRVIGINTSGLSRHMPITVPHASLRRVVEELTKKGRVGRAYLGLGMQAVHLPERWHALAGGDSGVIVVNVDPRGPSETAGVLLGDVIIGFDGSAVADTESLLERLSAVPVGTSVALRLLRAGAELAVDVPVGERP